MTSRGERGHEAIRAIAVKVREQRLKLGILQEELAHRAGLHRTYVSDIERGNRNIALTNLVRLADALEVPVGDLFTADIFQRAREGIRDDDG
jgi:transcriptional regulator with XRE-family HTH domain